MASILLKNGVIVSPIEQIKASILIEDGKISRIIQADEEVSSNGVEVIDLNGKFVMPGCVDGHTHMMDPGLTEREDFTTGTRAAAYGGITTVIDHHRTVPAVYSAEEHFRKVEHLKDKSVVDFSLIGGGSAENIENFESMWDAGIVAFKLFTCDLHGVKKMSAANLEKAFSEIARIGGTILIHCEEDSILAENESRLKREGRLDFMSHIEWRSSLAEEVAVQTVIAVARKTKVRLIVAHVSQPYLLQQIKDARDEGFEIYAESCPQYFNLTTEDLEKKGPWVKFTPPVKDKNTVNEMWPLLADGYVTVIGSDHCPYPIADKKPGEANIWDAPNGIPGIETSLRLMLNGVNEGKVSLNRIVEVMSENPAKLYGLYPQKGVIAVGSDADIVVLDMNKRELISNDKVVSKCKWSPYDGKEIKGAPELVFVRGKKVMEKGEVLGQAGDGRFVSRLNR